MGSNILEPQMTAIALLESARLVRLANLSYYGLELPALVEEHVCAPPHGVWHAIQSDLFKKGRVGMYKCPECEQCFAAGSRE
jgi:hypothetical protein